MSIALPLEQMTIHEKLEAMEALWIDLTKQPENFDSPVWHEAVLKARDERVKSGQETFMDWDDAKRELLERHAACGSRRAT